MGALSVTYQPKYQAPFEPLIPGVVAGKLNDISALDKLITQETCGVIVEPIQVYGFPTTIHSLSSCDRDDRSDQIMW